MSSQSNNENSNPERSYTRDRRGSSLSDFFSSNRQPQSSAPHPGPITTAAAHANNQRRMSLSGLNGSPPKLSTGYAFRRGSVSSISSSSSVQDESAIDDSEPASGSPSSPFARRMSWGARALREVRLPGASRGMPPSPGASSPIVSQGFDPALQQRRMSMPAPPTGAMPASKAPAYDPVQERILRNELYMD
ncbi:hypothetical protein FN846DRAFT_899020 [Sphaerosporella brunnea]|uniref:Uncharacterized protein n=1 Tax=Sphaerosporella brunnea TaxID=1250544 RepID=A0A5J5EWC9_9PEZI|nr:hypothetical protein FN846DRAFT_899020 [Sphaerosporella brunnea]